MESFGEKLMSIYQEIYDLINQYIFNNGATNVGSNAELICMLIASLASIFLIILPFLIVWKALTLIMGR